MSVTTNLGLKIWGALDRFLRTEVNDNFQKIDTAVGNPSSLSTTEKTELVGAVNEVKSVVDTLKGAGAASEKANLSMLPIKKILNDNGTTIIDGTLTIDVDTAQIDFTALDIDQYRFIICDFNILFDPKSNIEFYVLVDSTQHDIAQGSYIANTSASTSPSGGSSLGLAANTGEQQRHLFQLNNIENEKFVFYRASHKNTGFHTTNVLGSGRFNFSGKFNGIRVKGYSTNLMKAGSTFTLLGVK